MQKRTEKGIKLVANKKEELLSFLLLNIKNKSRNNIKTFLKNNMILVNGKEVNKYNYLLKENDKVEVNFFKKEKIKSKVRIIYEDEDIIVVDKDTNVLSVSTNKEKNKTVYHYLLEYLEKKNENERLFIVHRLDKDTSGVLLFAKNQNFRDSLQNDWNSIVTKRSYIAVVKGTFDKKEGSIVSYLKENKEGNVYASYDGKKATTNYIVLMEKNDYSLLEVEIESGRKNQIRVQLNDIKHPILGDKKYGDVNTAYKRLFLHAKEIEFTNPMNNKKEKYEAKTPKEFLDFFK